MGGVQNLGDQNPESQNLDKQNSKILQSPQVKIPTGHNADKEKFQKVKNYSLKF